ncbi:hypothetical protein BDY24DRAFT_386971 [Mrakia frigida]|uniref:uncharacterized protein n=1 Tax=Mrakia frigida TaxID=29902 RepID=UPI003FCC041D
MPSRSPSPLPPTPALRSSPAPAAAVPPSVEARRIAPVPLIEYNSSQRERPSERERDRERERRPEGGTRRSQSAGRSSRRREDEERDYLRSRGDPRRNPRDDRRASGSKGGLVQGVKDLFSSGGGGRGRDQEGRRRRSDESFNDERRRMGMGRRGYDSADPGYGYVGRSGRRNGAPIPPMSAGPIPPLPPALRNRDREGYYSDEERDQRRSARKPRFSVDAVRGRGGSYSSSDEERERRRGGGMRRGGGGYDDEDWARGGGGGGRSSQRRRDATPYPSSDHLPPIPPPHALDPFSTSSLLDALPSTSRHPNPNHPSNAYRPGHLSHSALPLRRTRSQTRLDRDPRDRNGDGFIDSSEEEMDQMSQRGAGGGRRRDDYPSHYDDFRGGRGYEDPYDRRGGGGGGFNDPYGASSSSAYPRGFVPQGPPLRAQPYADPYGRGGYDEYDRGGGMGVGMRGGGGMTRGGGGYDDPYGSYGGGGGGLGGIAGNYPPMESAYYDQGGGRMSRGGGRYGGY